jgi:hypothetical protein
MSDAPPPVPPPGAAPPGRRPLINVREVINKSARQVSLWDLASEGKKSIKVVNLKKINETLGRAIERTLLKYEKQIGHALRRQIEREASKNFLELMDLHKKVVEDKDQYRQKMEEEVARLRDELQHHQGSLDQEKTRKLERHVFMLSDAGYRDLEKQMRRILASFMDEERRLQVAESGPGVLKGLNEIEKSLSEALHRIVEEERRREIAEQERVRTQERELLERRLAKLQEALTLREKALEEMAKLKEGDPGIASIYKSVQGLADHESNKEKKKEMLRIIFEKNVELREQLARTA